MIPREFGPLNLIASMCLCIFAVTNPVSAQQKKAQVSSLKPADLKGFDSYPPKVKQYVAYALELTAKDLRYQYGSNDPKNGGMDCSGTVQHILGNTGHRAPRQSNYLYLWVRKNGNLHEVKKPKKLSEDQMSHLLPGDLLFWEGTYDVGKRFPATSHVMIFLGHRVSDGKPVMVGASSGRTYQGKSRHGVSVFDFRLPRSTSSSQFVGYGPVPGVKSLGRNLPPLINPASSQGKPEKENSPKKGKPKPANKPSLIASEKPQTLSASLPITEPTIPIKPQTVPARKEASPPRSKMGDQWRNQSAPKLKKFFKKFGQKSKR